MTSKGQIAVTSGYVGQQGRSKSRQEIVIGNDIVSAAASKTPGKCIVSKVPGSKMSEETLYILTGEDEQSEIMAHIGTFEIVR